MIGLTTNQARLLGYITSCIQETGSCPSFEDMRVFMGRASKATVFRMVKALEAKGRIQRHPGRHRAIEIVSNDTVKLNPEIFRLARQYASEHGIHLDTAANELLRGALGAM